MQSPISPVWAIKSYRHGPVLTYLASSGQQRLVTLQPFSCCNAQGW